MSRPWRAVGSGFALAAVIAGCQERLTSPAECPELCPGGSAQVFDTVVPALALRDSSFPAFADRVHGYVDRGEGLALLVSDSFPASEDRALYRFTHRPSLIPFNGENRSYVVDSVLVGLRLVARDTLVNGLKVYVYRLPSTIDGTVTFASLDPLLVDANLIDSVAVPDSVNTGPVNLILRGADVAKLGLVPGGDSVLAIGLRIAAESPTGIRIGSTANGTGATFTNYVTVDTPDTAATRNQVVNLPTDFNTFVTQNPIEPVDSLLTIGGEPSSRALIRFGLSDGFLDSTTVVRATLELTPVRPIFGLPTDPSALQTLAVLADLGAKSPLTDDLRFKRQDTLSAVQSDTVRIEVTRYVQLWQSVRTRPQSLFILMVPEAATFGRGVFFSTRSHVAGDALVAPRLRITYQRSFPFENP